MIANIELRISEWTHLPPDYGEPIQASVMGPALGLVRCAHMHVPLL